MSMLVLPLLPYSQTDKVDVLGRVILMKFPGPSYYQYL